MLHSLKKYLQYFLKFRFKPHFFYTFFSFLVIFYANYKGVGLTYDSQNYLYSSKSFSEKGIFLNKNNTPYIQQPPLFPLILYIFPQKNALFIAIFQCFLLSSIVFLWLLMADIFLDKKIFFHLFALSLCFATPLYLVHHFLWSEPIFMLLLSFDLYFFSIFLAQKPFENKNNHLFRLIFLMTIVSFLYCLQRNTGVFFVFGKVLYYFLYGFYHQKYTFFYQKTNIYFIFFAGFLAISGWVFWTILVFQSHTEKPFLTHFSWNINLIQMLFHNGKDLLKVFSIYFLPLPYVEKLGFYLQIFMFFIIFLMIFFAKKTKFLGFIALIYVFFLLFFVPDFSDSERYLAVIYPIFLIIFYENISQFYDFMADKKKLIYRFCSIFVLFFLIYFQIYHVVRTYKNVIFFQKIKTDWKNI
ncbi:MAG: hypothetical protein EAZ85_05865 [Bacteroidetes bacterium]|nr:MAG: hypothetical protein EAZ85_05865 [Bacteroidota bacterium]TAG86257.1 MAG: hypothetical protein EAZ20_13190 [Bacteroidota bacterium]